MTWTCISEAIGFAMPGTSSPPNGPESGGADDGKRRSLQIQVGRHVDITFGVYVSPQALALLGSLGAGAGAWFGILNR
ncbi:hypothetical protein [Streptomyces sp. NPDC053367]|uniref:hypothetical protein n=1 Tax=Streptomyces sp. NPDC053367 TaxID=3365700 RepID=UPI0037CD27B0